MLARRLAARVPDREAAALALGYSATRVTGTDYCWSSTRLLFEVALDDWALDEALIRLEQLTSGHLGRSAFGGTAYQRIELLEPSVKLAERLAAAHQIDQAKQALGVARDILPRVREAGLHYDYFEKAVEGAESVLTGTAKPRFVFNHQRQIENAHKLGAIDQKRYESTRGRLEKRASDGDAAREAQEKAFSSASFLQQLPTDDVSAGVSAAAGLTPQPGYFQVRIESLSTDQQAEYVRAFASSGSLELVQKYAWVRLSSLFRSAIYHISSVNPTALGAEIRLLTELQPRCAPHAADVLRVVNVLSGLAPADRAGYAAELQGLLEPETMRFSTPLGDIAMTTRAPATELSARFLDSAMEAGKPFAERGGTQA